MENDQGHDNDTVTSFVRVQNIMPELNVTLETCIR
jgi:hypothetical protein